MDMTIDQQVALDEALIPHASRLRIGRRNFCLQSEISSKESTLQLEFWATDTVHHHFIRFKMDNKKHIVNLEYFREILHICPRLPGQTFDEPPFEEEILFFLYFLGHSGEIRRLTDVNINKLHQPWRSFTAIINKFLSGKSSGYDSLRLSQAHILWGFYHKRNVDFAYLLWEDFVYQVEHKDTKKSNEMYYPRFTKVIIHYFMSKDPSIPRRNKVNWQYVRDDQMFTTIKLSSFDTTITPPPTAAARSRLFTSVKGKQPAKASKAKSLTALFEVAMTEAEQLKLDTKRSLQQTHISQASGSGTDKGTDSNKGGEEFIHPRLSIYDEEETKDEESFDPIAKTPENTDDKGNDKENLGLNVGREEGQDEEDDEDELYKDININLEGRAVQMADNSFVLSQFVTSLLNPTTDVGIDSIFKTTSQMDVQPPTIVASFPFSAPNLIPSAIATITTIPQAPTPPKTAPSTLLQNLPNFGLLFGFDHRLKTLEENFSDQGSCSNSVRQNRDEAQAENEEFLKNLNQNIQKIIKEQAEVLTRSSNSSKTSYAIAADLSEMKLKKNLIEKIEGNKSIHQFNEQRNLYKPLVEAYESDKIILDTYGDTVTLKRRHKDEEPFAGSDQGSKRQREGKEPESVSALIKDNREKDKIKAKTRQNQEQTGSMEKSKVKPDKVKAQSKPRKHQMKENAALGTKIVNS
nr:hypothetical protein [Tanacetum cinerariifolium]